MVYREKPSRNVTRLVGSAVSGSGEGSDPVFYIGSCSDEAPVAASGWTAHVNTPSLVYKNDPEDAIVPIPGGLQFEVPGVYTVEAVCVISGGAADTRFGFAFYTDGSIHPNATVSGYGLGGVIVGAATNNTHTFTAKTTFVVLTAGAKVLMRDYVQTATSHTAGVRRISAFKQITGGPGPSGTDGADGLNGANWGYTSAWAFADATDVDAVMPNGDTPRVGDFLISTNGFSEGQVYNVTAVYPSGNVDIEPFTPMLNIKGPQGDAGTALDAWPIDSVYISFSNTNPASLFGGTWTSIGAGRMLIGVDSGDTAMDAAGETGGNKTTTLAAANLPAHVHTINHDHETRWNTTDGISGTVIKTGASGSGTINTSDTTMISAHTGDSGPGPGSATPFSNLPPYLAVYMWRRTA